MSRHRRGPEYERDHERTRESPAYREPEPEYDPYLDDDYYDPELARRRQEIIFRKISNVVWLITMFILAVIMLRVVLLLINANQENPFVSWVYDTSWFFVRPFADITTDVQLNGSVFEINSLIAVLIYMLLIYGILQLVRVVLDLTTPTDP